MLRAGLYDAPGPDPDDHWANGETLTDETDAAMISTCLAGAGTETMRTALLGIAYARISEARPRPLDSTTHVVCFQQFTASEAYAASPANRLAPGDLPLNPQPKTR